METQYKGLYGNWDQRRIRELWSDGIIPRGVSQQDITRNKWTMFSKANNWYTCNKKTLFDSDLGIDNHMTLPDVDIAEITMGKEELRRLIHFGETDHPCTTQNEKGG